MGRQCYIQNSLISRRKTDNAMEKKPQNTKRQTSHERTYKTKDRETRTAGKTEDSPRCPEKVRRACFYI